MPRIIALQITKETLPLITVLNGGVAPWESAYGDYFICEITDAETTTKHDIISEGTFRAMQKLNPSIIEYAPKN